MMNIQQIGKLEEKSKLKNDYYVVGIMSGTSLDGLDVALCHFHKLPKNWKYGIVGARTYKYDSELRNKLANCTSFSAVDFISFHKEYGKYIGEQVNFFLKEIGFRKRIDFIASHGHTTFHQPGQNLTFQIGDGANIAASSGLTTISDFRNLDVALGGQGAPLVPIGDVFLFNQYDYCVNLGGFANLSYRDNGRVVAYDICPVNIVCNSISHSIGYEFDYNGEIGRHGKLNTKLLRELNLLEFYKMKPPKSLGKEWVAEYFLPILTKYKLDAADILKTLYVHIAEQIKNATANQSHKKVVFTGGGALNMYLIEVIERKINHQVILPEKEIIEFKEALIFAFLGVLRYRNEVNCLSSVTGSMLDNCGGSIFFRK